MNDFAQWDDDYEEPNELLRLVKEGELPRDHIVTGADLLMKPGQSLDDKARELGCSRITLRMWQLEHRGARYDPEYAIRRAGHRRYGTNTNRWGDKDWPKLVREETAKGHARHIGDVLFAVGLSACTAQVWSRKHPSFEQALWHSGIPYPRQHWKDYVHWLTHSTIERYRELKSECIAAGMEEATAAHTAADTAVAEIKHRSRQKRRIERDVLLGVGGHEELLRRYRGNARLTDAHSRRIAKQLFQVSRWVTMERALREIGEDEDSIKQTMAELMGAFRKSDEAGQAKWVKIRKAVLRRRAEADAFAKAEKVEALAVKTFVGARKAKYVKEWAKGRYGKPESKKRTSLTRKCA